MATPKNAVRKEVRVYDGSGKLIKSKTWRVKKLSSKKQRRAP